MAPNFNYYGVDSPQAFVWGSADPGEAVADARRLEPSRPFTVALPNITRLQQVARLPKPRHTAMGDKRIIQPDPPAKKGPQARRKTRPPILRPRPGKVMLATSPTQSPVEMAYAQPGGLSNLIKRAFQVNPSHNAKLIKVHAAVVTSCFSKNSQLTAALNKISAHYGGKPIQVTSGYRSLKYNTKVNGAHHSQHMHCAAADIAVDGVSKEQLRRYVRTLPEVGGIGIYNMRYLHIDTGRRREWDWRKPTKRARK